VITTRIKDVAFMSKEEVQGLIEKGAIVPDCVGTQIVPGCYLAYAVREGSCHAALRIGKVLSVDTNPNGCGKLVPEISIVMRAEYFWKDKVAARKTTLSIPQRALVIPNETLTCELIALLDTVK
jgi:hypothetical protein